MADFETCLMQVLDVEKGFVDHPADRGGPTNLGVTQETLSRFLGRPVTVGDVRSLTPEKVAPIYRRFYWDPIRGDELPDRIAEVLFNQAVHWGPDRPIRCLQVSLGLRPDGIIGPKTIAAIVQAPARHIIFDFLRETHDSYMRTVQADPSQLIFIRGWSNRVFDLLAANFR